ncbi:acyl-CoA thioesterase [Palleronia marisminoris]|uniref:Acyl-coenzyme A thioesterase PaaI n=1 Tax=Palleronia marisminoris TaxID=315423 RepID=A0A1Y5RAS2_9RHOB|nr:hydroxyphenylacetyl-CoA thioesterase PaaI [Palleronia marisminoris]SFG10162.1 acyl-CoA thioesterase [Palleronia marisminoris]SLN13063.1 Acyl-coenzyme A thioesterase PaaI [Palleronia marisminoris]
MSDQDRAEACAARMWSTDHASQSLGIVIERVAPGQAELSMTFTDAMANGHGMVHGGYIFALADSAFAFACNTYDEVTVAQHCAITYLRPGQAGERLTATAREVSRSGRSGIYDIRVCRADGTAVAEFRGHSRSLGRPILAETAQ